MLYTSEGLYVAGRVGRDHCETVMPHPSLPRLIECSTPTRTSTGRPTRTRGTRTIKVALESGSDSCKSRESFCRNLIANRGVGVSDDLRRARRFWNPDRIPIKVRNLITKKRPFHPNVKPGVVATNHDIFGVCPARPSHSAYFPNSCLAVLAGKACPVKFPSCVCFMHPA